MKKEKTVIKANIKGIDLIFKTSPEVFSPKSIDRGTLAMLNWVVFNDKVRVLDLGCGYGVVGILAAKILSPEQVVMVDNNPIAVQLSKENVILNDVQGITVYLSDGFNNMDESDFSLILCNPPYHADFSIPKHFIHKGFNRLRIGGRMVMVTKREQWYKKKLMSIFGNVKNQKKDGYGYNVFVSIKNSSHYANI